MRERDPGFTDPHVVFISLLAEGVAVTMFLAMLFVWLAIYATRGRMSAAHQPSPRTTQRRISAIAAARRPDVRRRIARKLPWSRMTGAERWAAKIALRGPAHA